MSSLTNWCVRLSRAGLSLACVTRLTGCPELHHVEVRMKAGSGGGAEGAAEGTAAAAVAAGGSGAGRKLGGAVDGGGVAGTCAATSI